MKKQIHKLFEAKAMEKKAQLLHIGRKCPKGWHEVGHSIQGGGRWILCREKDTEQKRSMAEIKRLAKDILALHKPDELWCAWCKKWGNHRSGNCPDKDCATIEKMFKDCGRTIRFEDFTQLDCTATEQCQSKTETVRRKP